MQGQNYFCGVGEGGGGAEGGGKPTCKRTKCTYAEKCASAIFPDNIFCFPRSV